MSKPVNKALIGLFIIGAVILLTMALLIFGSSKFFTHKNKFAMYFKGSVKGLNIGSPIMFRGVKIGQVTDILLLFNPENLSITIPVYIEIDKGLIGVPEEYLSVVKTKNQYPYIQPFISKGLKGQLVLQSFVTGQLMINLDFYPDKPINLVGLDKKYPEIPTIPSNLEELGLDMKKLYTKFAHTIDRLDQLINAPETSNTLTVTRDTMKQTEKTLAAIENLTGDYTNLRYDINGLIKEFSALARSLRDFFDYLERHPESILVGKKRIKED